MSVPTVAIGVIASRGPGELERTLGRVLDQVGEGDAIRVEILEGNPDPLESLRRVEEARFAHAGEASIEVSGAEGGTDLQLASSPAVARNRILAECEQDAVAFLHDGGIPAAGWLDALRESLADPGVDAVAGRLLPPPDSPERGAPPGGRLRWTGHLQLNYSAEESATTTLASGANCAVRSRIAIRVGGFDEGFTAGLPLEDVEFFARLSKAGGRARFVPRALVHFDPPARPEASASPAEAFERREAELERQAARTCAMATIFARHEVWALPIMATSHVLQSILEVFADQLPNTAPLRIVKEIAEGVGRGVRPVHSPLRATKKARR
jgi:hypothetical protein